MIIDNSPSNIMALEKRIRELEWRQKETIKELESIAYQMSGSTHEIDATDLDAVVAFLITGEWPQ